MRNLKKIIAVVVTLVMLFAITSISASAATAPVFALYGKTETNLTVAAGNAENQEYYELTVYLEDTENQVGAIQGVITYNPTIFTYHQEASELGAALDDGSNTVANSLALDEAGTIKFVGVANEAGVWFILRFTVDAIGSASFGLVAEAANATGTAQLDVTAKPLENATVTDEAMINMEGGAILQKTVDLLTEPTQDLAFNVVIDSGAVATAEATHGEVTEIGTLLMYTKRLGNRELKIDMENKTGLVHASKAVAAEGPVASFVTNLRNIKWNGMGVSVSARAYIKFEDGTVIYSKNFNNVYETNSGYARESVIGVAVDAVKAGEYNSAKAAELGYNLDAINTIVGQSAISGQDRIDLLKFIADCYEAN